MKKILLLIFCLILCFSAVSCFQLDKKPQSDTTESNAKDGTGESDVIDEDESNCGGQPIILGFSSYEEVKDFIRSTSGTQEEFVESCAYYGVYYDYYGSAEAAHEQAQKTADMFLAQPLPLASNMDFRAEYYLERSYFTWTCFLPNQNLIYMFDVYPNTGSQETPNKPVVLENVSIGSHVVDFYEGQELSGGGIKCVGGYQEGSSWISITIKLNNGSTYEDISFDQFSITPVH